jgi:protein SCO1/2
MRVVAMLVAGLLAGCSGKTPPPAPFMATDITGASFGRDFRLSDQNGKIRTLGDFKGKAVLLFFGYTHCPDVCLTTLSELAMVVKELGADGRRVQVLFVTLDPGRDMPASLGKFVTYFHPDFLGLRGDEAATAETAKEFRVYYRRHDSGSAAGYFLDHSAGVYGFDTEGRLRIFIDYGTDPALIMRDVKLLLGKQK